MAAICRELEPWQTSPLDRAVFVAIELNQEGRREVLAAEVAHSESRGTSSAFVERLMEQSLSGVQPLVSDAHAGF